MGKIAYGNYREMTIPELSNILKQHKWYFNLATQKKVPNNDPFLAMVIEQNKQATEALIIVKLEAHVKELKRELGIKEYEYDLKWMDTEDFKKKWEGEVG